MPTENTLGLLPPRRVSRLAGRALSGRLGAALAWPHGVDRYLELLDPLLARGETRARVVAARMETADCRTLVLAPGGGWAGFAAGQHLQVGVEIDGVRHTRCFSIASSARRADGCIALTVKAHADGQVSRHLVESAAVGDVLTLSAPAGDFLLPTPRPERLLLISGGSGITPVMAMLRTLVDEQYAGEVIFLHYARTRADEIFAAELAAMAEQHSNLRVAVSLTREARNNAALSGHFSADHVAALAADYAHWPTRACGPAPLIEAVQTHWQEIGASDGLQVEYFQPPVSKSRAGTGEVRFAESGHVATDTGASLLEQAEAAGLEPAYGCRMGICHTCTCRKTAGRVRNLLTGAVSGEGEEDIQPCISVPDGDVSLAI